MATGLLTPTHLAILFIVVLLVLGPKKLPDTGRALGRSLREFRNGLTGGDDAPLEYAGERAAGMLPRTTRSDDADDSTTA